MTRLSWLVSLSAGPGPQADPLARDAFNALRCERHDARICRPPVLVDDEERVPSTSHDVKPPPAPGGRHGRVMSAPNSSSIRRTRP